MRRSGGITIAISAVAVGALAMASANDFAPMLVFNASASAPIGLYRIDNRAPELGEFALVLPDEKLEQFLARRGYLPENIPLIKRVAALPGDEICREAQAIFINETRVADARIRDSLGRTLPQWRGCFTLQSDEIFLLNDHEDSLDGRYFGATAAADVIGAARAVRVRR
jgi:conjugative transfer signal peptidase TraF